MRIIMEQRGKNSNCETFCRMIHHTLELLLAGLVTELEELSSLWMESITN